VTTVLLTHGHLDHINGLGEAVSATGATVRCHELEVPAVREYVDAERIAAVGDREPIAVGNGIIEAIHTPGHTPSCVCFYLPEESALITGDVVFVGKVGSASDPATMKHSLHQVIAALPEETRIYPGHDYGETPTSLLGWELGHNPGFTG
jgi:glyoxylase-like metal-dependent hydrolase (beta-lactamase superfamily II)